MTEFKYTIKDPVGIHARPAGLLVKLAGDFNADITVTNGEKTADAKKIFALMGLGAKAGTEITVTASGDDEQKAADAIQTFLHKNL